MRRVVAAAFVAAIVLVGCTTPGMQTRGGRFDAPTLHPPTTRPRFTLTDTSGRTFDFWRQTKGRLTLLYFGYTSCPDICPVNMEQVHAAVATGDIGNPLVVFVTVDPARDTRAKLRRWLDHIDRSFIGLVGTDAQVRTAERAAGVPLAVKQGRGKDYTMGHAAQVLTYAADNRGYVQFPFGTRQASYVHDLGVLVQIAPTTRDSS